MHRQQFPTNAPPAAAAPRRASLDAQSGLSASSSSLFSELSWGSDCDEEVVARHLGMSEKSLQDHLEYKKKDDTSSLSTETTSRCGDDIDGSASAGTEADAVLDAEKDPPVNNHRVGGTSRRMAMRPRASIRESIVSITGSVLESIRECDVSSDEEATHQGESVTFAKFEPSPANDGSVDYGSEGSLQFDDLFGEKADAADVGTAIGGTDTGKVVSKRGVDEDTFNPDDAAAVSREFNKSGDTRGTSSTSSVKGSTSRSSSKGSSKSSKPDPPESTPVLSSEFHRMNASASSMHIDNLRQLHILPMPTEEDHAVQKKKKKSNRTKDAALPFEIKDVFVPRDVADDVVSGIHTCTMASDEANKTIPTIPPHFIAGSDTVDDGPNDNIKFTTSTTSLRRQDSQDSDGNIISGMISTLKSRLMEASNDVDANPPVIPQDRQSTDETTTSVLLGVIIDVKAKLADVNMRVDNYRMKQRQLSEENEQLTRNQALLEQRLEVLTMERDQLHKKLRESEAAQTHLKVELEASQTRLADASKSEKQANLTLMNVMHHKNMDSTSEFLDFDPDLNKWRADDGTARTDDLTQEQISSKRSLFSSMSNIGDGSSRAIRPGSSVCTIHSTDDLSGGSRQEQGLFRRLSNMFNTNESRHSASAAPPTGGEHKIIPASSSGDNTEMLPNGTDTFPEHSSLAEEAHPPPPYRPSRRHSDEGVPTPTTSTDKLPFPRRSSTGCNYMYSSKGTRSLIADQEEEGTMPLNAAPRSRSHPKKEGSTRSLNTHADVMEFMETFAGNASFSTFSSDLGSIQEQD